MDVSLTIANEMFHTSDHALLHAHDSLVSQLTSEVWIGRKSLPITPSSGRLTIQKERYSQQQSETSECRLKLTRRVPLLDQEPHWRLYA